MDGLLEGATVLSVCKVACALPFVRSVSGYSPVSFCCCCLLLFTDVILSVFFSVLLVLDHWQTELPLPGDVIALRTLLFISHTYAAVLILALPAVIVDKFVQLLQRHGAVCRQMSHINDATKRAEKGEKKPFLAYHVVAYLCCLTLWIFGTLQIRWRWKLDEVWTAACLYSTESLLYCLPNLYSPMMSFLHPCWVLATGFIALAVILSVCLLCRKPAIMQLKSPDAVAVSLQNSCETQMLANRDVELSSGRAKAETKSAQGDDNRTEKVIPLTLTEERQSAGTQSGNGRVFPCPGADVMIGVVCVLAMFLLPLILSVNIHLMGSVEKILQWGMKCFELSKSFRLYTDMDII